MAQSSKARLTSVFLVISAIGGFLLFAYYRWDENVAFNHTPFNVTLKYSGQSGVDMACKMPYMDPFDKVAMRYISGKGPLICPKSNYLTYKKDNIVYIDKATVKSRYGESLYCVSACVYKGSNDSDDKVKFVETGVKFSNFTKLTCEHTRIYCYYKNIRVHVNFFSYIFPKNYRNPRRQEILKKHIKDNGILDTYSILMIGMDSLPRSNFIRLMPRTRNYLLKTIGSVELKSYNKIGDNTFKNIVGILLGKHAYEYPADMWSHPFDKYDMMFKRYAARGYISQLTEDLPHGACFSYKKKGFYRQPTDSYFRPVAVAYDAEKSIWTMRRHCINERHEADIILDYIYQFVKTNTDLKQPYFSFGFLTHTTHDYTNEATFAEEPHLYFLQRLHKENLLNNTILFYYSDHGMRYGPLRETFIGKLEENMPLMTVRFPESFKKKYPKIYRNVLINTERLTTPFDIHATLEDLLHFNETVKKAAESGKTVNKKCSSILREVSPQRTCESATIKLHWCNCQTSVPVNISHKIVPIISKFLVDDLNKATKKFENVCAPLKLKETVSLRKYGASDDVVLFRENVNRVKTQMSDFHKRMGTYEHYLLTIRTQPGGGLFEATIKHKLYDNSFFINGEVSRINKYGLTSSCIDDAPLQKICYCKNQKLALKSTNS